MTVVIGILIGLVAGGVLAAVGLAFTGGTRLAAARRTRQLLIQEARQEAETLRRAIRSGLDGDRPEGD